jgi:hypothetical protein
MQASDSTATGKPSIVFHTIKGFREARNIPHSSFYKLVKDRKIKIVKLGRRSLVHDTEAKRFDESLLSAA